MPRLPRGGAARLVALGLLVALLLVVWQTLRVGSAGALDLEQVARGVGAAFGLADPLENIDQTVLELRLHRALTSIGVGAGLALSGGLLQGVFRNDLASPSIIGVSSGASLGASVAILVLGGYGPLFMLERVSGAAPWLVTGCAFAGAMGAVLLVTALSTTGGRVSVATLLLVGVALNATLGGMLAALQSFAMTDYEASRALLAWGFGNLDDRSTGHVVTVLVGTGLAAAAIPFVATELDLFASGEDDARALGVRTTRVKALSLAAAALAAAVAVSVAGQIAFIGLVVPHILRRSVNRSHRALLPLCLLGGPLLLLGSDLLQRTVFHSPVLRPGVLMSLLGGPFFLYLLVRDRRSIRT